MKLLLSLANQLIFQELPREYQPLFPTLVATKHAINKWYIRKIKNNNKYNFFNKNDNNHNTEQVSAVRFKDNIVSFKLHKLNNLNQGIQRIRNQSIEKSDVIDNFKN